MATQTRQVEIFSAGCPVCEETIKLVNDIACGSCEIAVLDMHDPTVAERARSLGIRSVPAVLIDGELAACCEKRGPDKKTLQEAGIGRG